MPRIVVQMIDNEGTPRKVLGQGAVTRSPFRIGRASDNNLPLPVTRNTGVSRYHAELVQDDQGGWQIVHKSQKGQTFVNDKPVTIGALKDGDRIRVGPFLILFQDQPADSRSQVNNPIADGLADSRDEPPPPLEKPIESTRDERTADDPTAERPPTEPHTAEKPKQGGMSPERPNLGTEPLDIKPGKGADDNSPWPHFEGYQIVGKLGEGGFGRVYRAWQESPHRLVALKVMLEGSFAGPDSKRRFEREVEMAGRLNHPSIAAIYYAGVAREPYFFAMEYVEGQRLDHHAEKNSLSIKDRLRLFGTICEAVNHAHQRGVIHRDLKPSNIMVTLEGQPKVLDFGLAKQFGPDEGEDRLRVTKKGDVWGTPEYMSPEQAGASPDLDVRTDVYSLGVVLYELLAHDLPYDRSEWSNPYDQNRLVKLIADTNQPVVPPTRFNKQIDDEVETIILMALAKERERRYQSAGELADDINNYLTDRPIRAKRDSAGYVLRKTLARHKLPVGIATALVVLLTGFGITASGLYARAERSRRDSEKQRALAELNAFKARESEGKERTARQEAETQKTTAEKREKEAITARDATEWQAYKLAIGRAQALLENGQTHLAKETLEATSKHLRSWEWDHLHTRCLAKGGKCVLLKVPSQDKPGGLRYPVFSPDGTLVSAGGHVWDVRTNHHLGRFIPDGTSVDKSGNLWNVRTSQPQHLGSFGLEMCGDSRTVVSHVEGKLSIHDVREKTILFSADKTQLPVVDSEGQYVVWSDTAGRVSVWDVANRRGKAVEGVTCATHLAVAPKGSTIALALGDNEISLRGFPSYEEIRRIRFPSPTKGKLDRITYSPDGAILATFHICVPASSTAPAQRSSERSSMCLWDAVKGPLLMHIALPDGLSSVDRLTFSQNGRAIGVVLRVGELQKLAVYTVESGELTANLPLDMYKEHTGVPGVVCPWMEFSADCSRFAHLSAAFRIDVWSLANRPPNFIQIQDGGLITPAGFLGPVVCWHPEKHFLAATSLTDVLRVWDASTGRLCSTYRLPAPTQSYLTVPSFSRDAHRLVACSFVFGEKSDDVVRRLFVGEDPEEALAVVDIKDGSGIARMPLAMHDMFALTQQDLCTIIYPREANGRFAVSVLDIESGKRAIPTFTPATAALFSPTAVGEDGTLSVVCPNPSVTSLAVSLHVPPDYGQVALAAMDISDSEDVRDDLEYGFFQRVFSKDGSLLGIASGRTAVVYDCRKGLSEQLHLSWPTKVTGMAFDPSNRLVAIAAAGEDMGGGQVTITEISTKRPRRAIDFRSRTAPKPFWVKFSAKGDSVLVALISGSDHPVSLEIYNTNTGQLVATITDLFIPLHAVYAGGDGVRSFLHAFSDDGSLIAVARTPSLPLSSSRPRTTSKSRSSTIGDLVDLVTGIPQYLSPMIEVHEVTTGRLVASSKGYMLKASALCFTPDGRRLAVTSDTGSEVCILDVASGEETTVLQREGMVEEALTMGFWRNSLILAGRGGIMAWRGSPDIRAWFGVPVEEAEVPGSRIVLSGAPAKGIPAATQHFPANVRTIYREIAGSATPFAAESDWNTERMYEQWAMIGQGASQDVVVKLLGESSDRVPDQWAWNDSNQSITAHVWFDKQGKVVAKQWVDPKRGRIGGPPHGRQAPSPRPSRRDDEEPQPR